MNIKSVKSIGLFFILVFSILVPISLGNDIDIKTKDDSLENLAYYSYLEIPSSKLSLLEKHLNYDINEYNIQDSDNFNIVDIFSGSSTGVPMNSIWPIICCNTRHIGYSPYSANNDQGEIKWRFFGGKYTEGGSAVIDEDGTIYYPAAGYLIAVNPDGTRKWKTEFHGGMPSYSSPALAEDGTIYVTSYAGALYALNPDGSNKWHHGGSGSISSPVIGEDGTIYYGDFGKKFNAVNPDGSNKWSYTTGEPIISSAAIDDNGIIYVGSWDYYFYAFYPNGTLNWRYKTGEPVLGPPSIGNDGTIYVGSYDDYLYAFYQNGTVKWKCKVGYGTETNPSIGPDGTIYVGGSKLYAVNSNGTIKWEFYLGSDRDIDKSSPIVSGDGTIYVGVTHGEVVGGELYAVNPDGTLLWKKTIDSDWLDNTPAIGTDGTVYISGTTWREIGGGGLQPWNYLYAFNQGEFQAYIDYGGFQVVGDKIRFHASAYNGVTPYTYHWDFGDGTTSTKKSPEHTYSSGGIVDVILTVTDDDGNIVTESVTLDINTRPKRPPKPEGPSYGQPGKELTFFTSTTDPDGDQLYYIWYYNDGSSQSGKAIGPYDSGEMCIVKHTYEEKGFYEIEVGVMDDRDAMGGLSDPHRLTIGTSRQRSLIPIFSNLFEEHPKIFTFLRFLYKIFE